MKTRHASSPGPRQVAAPTLRITAAHPPGAVVLHLAGEVDHQDCGALERAIAKALAGRPPQVVVDLSRLEYCGTSALNSLLKARRAAARAGSRLVLVAPSRPVTSLLTVTGTDAVFAIRPSVHAAVADPARGPRADGPA